MKCKATKLDGIKCKAYAMRTQDTCYRHTASLKEEAAQASSKGGQARRDYNRLGSPMRLKTPKDIQNLMAKALNSLWSGKMPASNPAGGIGYLAKIFLEAYEKSELEERIDLLEKRLSEIKS